jgi:hypothetical protein
MPLALRDNQLRTVIAAAASLPPEKRSVFLQRIAAQLQRIRRLEHAARLALRGLMQAPAA